jgi:hypothetical protein
MAFARRVWIAGHSASSALQPPSKVSEIRACKACSSRLQIQRPHRRLDRGPVLLEMIDPPLVHTLVRMALPDAQAHLA